MKKIKQSGKVIFILATVLMSIQASCDSKKKNVEPDIKSETITISDLTEGKVLLNKSEGECPQMIEIVTKGKKALYYPVHIPEQFRIHGHKIKFNYNLSRAPQPAECSQCVQVISLTNIELSE